jgi:YfiH family protein
MFLSCPNLSALPHIRHGFFTREGGVSDGIYASLNCGPGSGDAIPKVMENRTRAAKTLGAALESLVTCYQIHSANVVIIDKPWTWKEAPQADAVVTKTPGIALGILAADCLPVLFADAQAKVIGAAHAGWKGAISGVCENTISAMEKMGATRANIVASVGPGIAQNSYEVSAEFYERFFTESGTNALYFKPSDRADHYRFDLKAYVAGRLKAADISRNNVLAEDTCLDENRFFSFRRATLRKEPAYGRQISAILLEK